MRRLLRKASHSFAEALVMDDFALAEEFYNVVYVGVITEAQNIVIGDACLLLCYNHVFATFLLLIKTAKSLDL